MLINGRKKMETKKKKIFQDPKEDKVTSEKVHKSHCKL